MKLDQSFEVDAPLERVWSALLDIERVAPCLPGAGVAGRSEDGGYNGTFTVKIGPTTASYAGKLGFENVDEAAHTATIQATGTDRRGQGGARATIISNLHADGERTRVEVSTDYHITGRLARFGRGGMIEDIAERLLREFARNLQALLQDDAGASRPDEAGASAGDAGGSAGAETAEGAADETAEGAPDETAEGAPDEIAPASAVEQRPLDAGSLIASVAWQRARSSPLVPALIAAVALLLVFRRRRS
jgi:carbon monoxide dehydrogenase subunit G